MELMRFNEYVKKFKTTKNTEGSPLNLHYFLVKKGDNTYLHRFNNRKEKSDIRSISKTVMALAGGIVNRIYPEFNQDTLIYPIIKDVINLENEKNKEYLKKIKVKHLMSHSTGFDKVLLMRDDILEMDPDRYLDFIINTDLVYEPGEHYLYSNAGMYLLSVVLQEFLEEDLLKFLDRELFNPLGITDYHWERYGKYLAGATRLWLYPEDLLKIGELILNKGKYRYEKILNSSWIEDLTKPIFKTEDVDTEDRVFRRYAYGKGIWVSKLGFPFGHGTDGQILIILPEEEGIIITQSYEKDIHLIEEIVDEVVREIISPEDSQI